MTILKQFISSIYFKRCACRSCFAAEKAMEEGQSNIRPQTCMDHREVSPMVSFTASCGPAVQLQIVSLRSQTTDTPSSPSHIADKWENGPWWISALWLISSDVLLLCGTWVNWGRERVQWAVVESLSISGARMQGRDVKSRLDLLPVRLSGISKPILDAFIQPCLRVFYLCHALVRRAMSKESLCLIRSEISNR